MLKTPDTSLLMLSPVVTLDERAKYEADQDRVKNDQTDHERLEPRASKTYRGAHEPGLAVQRVPSQSVTAPAMPWTRAPFVSPDAVVYRLLAASTSCAGERLHGGHVQLDQPLVRGDGVESRP